MMSQPVRQSQNGGTGVTIHVLSDIQTSILNKLGQKSNKKLLSACLYIYIYIYISSILVLLTGLTMCCCFLNAFLISSAQ